MLNNFVTVEGNQLIIAIDQLKTYAVAAAAVIVVIIILVAVAKSRPKSFIRTIPTNVKGVK